MVSLPGDGTLTHAQTLKLQNILEPTENSHTMVRSHVVLGVSFYSEIYSGTTIWVSSEIVWWPDLNMYDTYVDESPYNFGIFGWVLKEYESP